MAKEAESRKRIGLIGLGRMGRAISIRLLDQGYDLIVYNRSKGPERDLVEQGARLASDPRQLGRSASIVISTLTDEDAVRSVCGGEHGLLADWAGGIHLGVSTLSPEAAARLAEMHAAAGATYMSSPVQGRPPMAEAGQLVAWVSGGRRDARVDEVLAAFARRAVWLGEDARHAAAAKLALNLLMNANIELFAEAFAYVAAHDVEVSAFGEALTETVFSAPLFEVIASSVASPDDSAKGSDVRISRKDLALLTAQTMGLRLPIADALADLFGEAERLGWGDRDPAVVRRLFNPRNIS